MGQQETESSSLPVCVCVCVLLLLSLHVCVCIAPDPHQRLCHSWGCICDTGGFGQVGQRHAPPVCSTSPARPARMWRSPWCPPSRPGSTPLETTLRARQTDSYSITITYTSLYYTVTHFILSLYYHYRLKVNFYTPGSFPVATCHYGNTNGFTSWRTALINVCPQWGSL